LPQYEIENWLHVYACSNSLNALKLSSDDRRWFVPESFTSVPETDTTSWWSRTSRPSSLVAIVLQVPLLVPDPRNGDGVREVVPPRGGAAKKQSQNTNENSCRDFGVFPQPGSHRADISLLSD
jgi:hypothetical protein